MSGWGSLVHAVLRFLASGLLLSALIGVSQPVIVCRCGTETPHAHTAWGFDPHHHHGVDALSGRNVAPDDEDALTSGDERLVVQALVAWIDADQCAPVDCRSHSPHPSCLSTAAGLSYAPEPPPPRVLV